MTRQGVFKLFPVLLILAQFIGYIPYAFAKQPQQLQANM